MYKEADMSYQYQFPAQFSENNCCYLLGNTLGSSCLFILVAILVSHVNFSHAVPFQLTYVERSPSVDGNR